MNIKGKNFLEKRICFLIIKKIFLNKNNKVLEIASGYGNFTRCIKKKFASKILEIELDNVNRNIINENIININYRIYGRIIIFGNIPYNITTLIIKKIRMFNNINCLYIMLQNEFIKKIYFFYKVVINYMRVYKKFFIPIPKVESSFIKVSDTI